MLSMTVTMFFLRGRVGDPHGDELLCRRVGDPCGDDLLREHAGDPCGDDLNAFLLRRVGDPRGYELLHGRVGDPHGDELLRGVSVTPTVMISMLSSTGALWTPAVMKSWSMKTQGMMMALLI